jgi:hypothetical protein
MARSQWRPIDPAKANETVQPSRRGRESPRSLYRFFARRLGRFAGFFAAPVLRFTAVRAAATRRGLV